MMDATSSSLGAFALAWGFMCLAASALVIDTALKMSAFTKTNADNLDEREEEDGLRKQEGNAPVVIPPVS